MVLRVLIAMIAAAAALYQGFASRDTLLGLEGRLLAARPPFAFEAGSFTLARLRPEAEAAGLKPGDRLVAVEGAVVEGRVTFARAMAWRQPGESLSIVVESAGAAVPGGTREAVIPLSPRAGPGRGALEWIPALILSLAMPWLCLLLGGWVAFARPGDSRAWLLMVMMLAFSQATGARPMHWSGAGGTLAVAWHSLGQSLWPAMMFLFALAFPQRLPLDRRFPWARWILAGPLVAFTTLSAVAATVGLHDLEAIAPLERVLSGLGTEMLAFSMAAIGLFFAAMGYKSGTLDSPDARRRARVLVVGAQAGLTPSMFLVGPALVRGVGPAEVAPVWLTSVLFSFLFLFPATLAYVVVVQRALDVRVVIRQGMQYTLARGGVKILRWLIMMAIVVGVVLLARRPGTRTVDTVRVLAIGGFFLALTGRASEKLMTWVDRRFFREAYDAEKILNDLAEKVTSLVDSTEILDTLAKRLSDSLHVPRVACLVAEPGGFRVARATGFEGGAPRVASERPLADDSATVCRLREEGGPVRVYLDDPGSWVNRGEGTREFERSLLRGLETQLLIPLFVKDRLPGIISLSAKRSEEAYSATDLRLLKTVASQTGLALENSRLAAAIAQEAAQRERMNREVEIAREVQERLFPQRLPPIQGLDYAGACRPALGVGGDYFDFLPLPGGRLGIAIGDVAGKGIGAALMMASLQASLRGQTMQGEGALARVIGNVNRLVHDASPDNRYATFFYAQYDPVRRTFTYVNAGHCPPMLLRRERGRDGVERLDGGGTVVGLFADAAYEERTVTIEPGDRIVAYTDGISEAFNKDDEEFGEDRLASVALTFDGLSAAEAIARLMEQTDSFVAGAPQSDDMTIVILSFAG